MKKRVHRKLHFGHKMPRGADVEALVHAVHHQLKHLKLGFLYRMRTPASRRHTIARTVFALGLSDAAHDAALRGEVGKWTQRKIRNPRLRSPRERARARKRRRTLRKWRHNHHNDNVTVMYDHVDPRQIPADAPAVAGYTGGAWPTYWELDDLFPHARRVSIAVFAREDADVLDIEPGNATPDQAPDWVKRQLRRRKEDPRFYNLDKPTVYAAVSDIAEIRRHLHKAGLLDEVNFWSAHIGQGEHICGPETCAWPDLTEPVDATQWTWTAHGRNLDQSKLSKGFF